MAFLAKNPIKRRSLFVQVVHGQRAFDDIVTFEISVGFDVSPECACLLLCAGARADVITPGLFRSMPGGRKAHVPHGCGWQGVSGFGTIPSIMVIYKS